MHTPPSPFDIAAVLITLAAILSWFNHRVFKLPSSVGLALMGAVASLITLLIDGVFPSIRLAASARTFLADIDFHQTLMEGMLSFLLFAGALHVDWQQLKRNAWPVAVLSTLGVLASTVIVGVGMKFAASLVGYDVPLVWCLMFGALISPTDPVAVMAAMKSAKAPPGLQATISGESLFNDGVGVVVFSIILATAAGVQMSPVEAGRLFLIEAVGGGALGIAIGWIAYRAMRAIDDYAVELLITLATVMGGYALAHHLHVSGPVAMAVAGLLLGNHGVTHAMSETTRDHIIKFWALVDEVLNAVLFLLIGLEGIALVGDQRLTLVGLIAIPLVLAARVLSAGPPLFIWPKSLPLRTTMPVLVWGGLRGGISIALALSLPSGEPKDLLVTATYIVVLFSVLVQGSTIRRAIPRGEEKPLTH
jgi:CPA1 family monovalent cation:H+ antiporter